MATARVEVVGPQEYTLVAELYTQIYRPGKPVEFFRRRYLGRYNPLMMVASVDGRPVGFYCGFELKPNTFFSWLYGVLPDFRRMGIASQLMDAAEAWVAEREYATIRFECQNGHRPMLHLAIERSYDVVGIRWDPDRGENLVIFEKVLAIPDAE